MSRLKLVMFYQFGMADNRPSTICIFAALRFACDFMRKIMRIRVRFMRD